MSGNYEIEPATTTRRASSFVPAHGGGNLTMNESDMLGRAVTAAGDIMSHRQMTHIARSDDSAVTQAAASLIYSAAYGIAAGIITTGLVVMAWLIVGGDGGLYALFGLILWGVCILASLAFNRWQGLRFSPAGLGHHEIESREKIAIHAIDRHVELIRLRMTGGRADE